MHVAAIDIGSPEKGRLGWAVRAGGAFYALGDVEVEVDETTIPYHTKDEPVAAARAAALSATWW